MTKPTQAPWQPDIHGTKAEIWATAVAATIERCAQVAEEWGGEIDEGGSIIPAPEGIAAAIRKRQGRAMIKRRFQKIQVEDHDDEWVNRLAVILSMFREMDEAEISATLNFVVGKYQRYVL